MEDHANEGSRIQFKEITNDERRINECLVNNYNEWGPPLSLDDYLSREKELHEIHIRNGFDHRSFALINETTNRAIAACEVLTRALYHGGGSFTDDNCIASVFVCPDYRNGGNCKNLIQHIVETFTSENSKCQMSLWSDIGDYYARVGFNFPPSFQGELQWNRSIVCTPPKTKERTDCEFLDAEETLDYIVSEHQRLLRRDADSVYFECQGEINIGIVLPHIGLYEQLQFRGLFTAKKLGLPSPKYFSARTADGHGWISWAYMFGSNKLMILGLFGSVNDMALLLAAATTVAADYDCTVELFESSIVEPHSDIGELLAATDSINLPVQLKDRDSSLPMSLGEGIWISQGGYAWY